MGNSKLLLGAVLLLAVVGGAIWVLSRDEPVEPVVAKAPVQMPEPAPVVPEPEPEPMPEAEPAPPPLPSLQESDPAAREALAAVGAKALVPEQTGDLISRAAVAMENASRGALPTAALGFMAPSGSFQVQRRDGGIFLDPAGFQRYQPVVQELANLDPAGVAEQLDRFAPLLEQSLTQLGVRGRSPRELVNQAISQVLAAPVQRGPVSLEQPSVYYQYADAELEALPELSKLMLRMGPENTERLQAWLRKVQAQLAADSGN